MGSRRKAREAAMQMLYQHDLAQQPIDELFETYWNEMREDADEGTRQYANMLVQGTIESLDRVDRLIGTKAENWRLERMAIVDRNILRLAVYEFLYVRDAPKVVVINEAIEIARRYSTYEATQFINGLLDAIRREVEPETS
ncbi:MAG: transcription antitermination factor NusB [candidate division WOR-3 bacterium]